MDNAMQQEELMQADNTINGHTRHRDLFFTSNKLTILPKVQLKQTVFIQNQPIGFIHTSKTGGTNIDYLMKALCKEKGLKAVEAYSNCKDQPSINIVTQGCIGGLYLVKTNGKHYDLSKKSDVQFIMGHMPLPNGEPFKVSVSYISIVRDPVGRGLSLGNFMYQRNFIKKDDIEKMLLTIEVDNLQTRALAGETYMRGRCTEDTFNKAISNIQEKFSIVAPIEEVDTVMSLIANHYGVNDVVYARAQISAVKIVTKENKELCQRILQRNKYDQKLYEYIKTNWESWKSNYIESISDNISDTAQYMVLSDSYYGKNQIDSMDLEQITLHALNPNEELIGLTQGYWQN